jgi:hypothetical protein
VRQPSLTSRKTPSNPVLNDARKDASGILPFLRTGIERVHGNPLEPIAEVRDLMPDGIEPVADAIDPIPDASESIRDAITPIGHAFGPISDSSDSMSDSSDSIADGSDPIKNAMGSVEDAFDPIADTLEPIPDGFKDKEKPSPGAVFPRRGFCFSAGTDSD